jgi:integrase
MRSTRKRIWNSKGRVYSAWVDDYFDQPGKHRQKTFTPKKTAVDWSVTARHAVRSGTHSPARASITAVECGAPWLDHCDTVAQNVARAVTGGR